MKLGLGIALNRRGAAGGAAAPPTDFRIVVKTDNAGVSNNDQFQFTGALGDYDVEVYDATGTTLQETITGLSDAATITIAAGAGTYELRVFAAATNGFNRIQFNNGGDKAKLLEVRNWGDIAWSTMEDAFYGCSNATSITSFGSPDLSSVTNFGSFARDCSSLTTLDVSSWDTSSVTFFGAFALNCSSLTALDVSSWDTSSVTSFGSFARDCSSLTTLDVSSWDTSSVTSFGSFARDCSSLTTLDVSSWDTSSVTDFGSFANNCSSLTTLDVSSWDTSSVTSFGSFARDCSSLTTLDVSSWDTSSVTNFGSFANNCSSLTALDVSSWDTSSVTDFGFFARDCSSLTDITGVDNFNISSVTNFNSFLQGTTLPTARYDQLLINYEAQAPNSGLNFHGGNSQYTLGGAAETARTSLATTYSWTITDGGGV
jgi:surface protein